MPQIKVTGFIDPEQLLEGEYDPGHKMGLTNQGYEHYMNGHVPQLGDVEFELVEDETGGPTGTAKPPKKYKKKEKR